MAALLSRVRPAVIVCVLITCSATNVHAVWGPYGTMLTQPYTYHGTGGAHVYPRPDASILVGYRPWAGTYPDYTSDWALVSADGDLLGSGRAGGYVLSWDRADAIYHLSAYADYNDGGHIWVGRSPTPTGWPNLPSRPLGTIPPQARTPGSSRSGPPLSTRPSRASFGRVG